MEREDRVIYTSHYNNITSVHLVFFSFFFSIKSDDAKIQNKQKHSKNYRQIFLKIPTNCTTFSLHFFLFCCITPGLIWRRPPEAAIDSGNADRHPTLRSRYRYPPYELWMHLPRGVQHDFYTAWMDDRQGVLIAWKCQNDMKINLHLVPDVFLFFFVSWSYIFIHENAVNHTSWRSVFNSTAYSGWAYKF